MNRILLVALLGVVGFAPVPLPRDSKVKLPTLEDLAGTWVIERYEIGTPKGVYEPEALYPRLVIQNGWWWKERDLLGEVVKSLRYHVTINPTKVPPWFDFKEHTAAKTPKGIGIFRLEGDRLTILFTLATRDRPPSVDVKLVDTWQRFTLRRKK